MFRREVIENVYLGLFPSLLDLIAENDVKTLRMFVYVHLNLKTKFSNLYKDLVREAF